MTNSITSHNNQRLYFAITVFAVLSVLSCAPPATARFGVDLQSGIAMIEPDRKAAGEKSETALSESYQNQLLLLKLIRYADKLHVRHASEQRSSMHAAHTGHEVFAQNSRAFVAHPRTLAASSSPVAAGFARAPPA
ncbi:MAG TPA: hypothetical protein VGK02_11830 [Candidatus Aquicultor sp.]|jgi:hypothetical protein